MSDYDEETRQEVANNHSKKGKAADSGVKAADLLKCNRIGREEEIEETVDEGHVNCNEENDGLSEQNSHRTQEILGQELPVIDLNLLLFGMDSPVFGTSPKLGSFLDENDRWIGFFEKERDQSKCRKSHDGADILSPTPAKV